MIGTEYREQQAVGPSAMWTVWWGEWEALVSSHILGPHWTVAKQVCESLLHNTHPTFRSNSNTIHTKGNKVPLWLHSSSFFFSCLEFCTSLQICLLLHQPNGPLTPSVSILLSLLISICLCHSILLSAAWPTLTIIPEFIWMWKCEKKKKQMQ